jgi:hypothetical protein
VRRHACTISQFCWRSCSPPATARIYPRYSFRCQQNGLNCRGPLHDLSIRVTYAQQPALPTPAALWRTACPKVCSAHQCGPSSGSAAKPIANASIARPAGNARDHVPSAASHAAPRPQPTVKPTITGRVRAARLRALATSAGSPPSSPVLLSQLAHCYALVKTSTRGPPKVCQRPSLAQHKTAGPYWGSA